MIELHGIYPRAFNANAFREAMVDEMAEMRDRIQHDFLRTTATWRRKPVFVSRVTVSAAQVFSEVYTENRIYCFLAGGTSKRYAVMTADFIPKTRPNIIGSFPGRGGFSHFDFDEINARRRAIVARNWDRVIARRYGGRRLQAALRRAMRRGRRESHHAI